MPETFPVMTEFYTFQMQSTGIQYMIDYEVYETPTYRCVNEGRVVFILFDFLREQKIALNLDEEHQGGLFDIYFSYGDDNMISKVLVLLKTPQIRILKLHSFIKNIL